MNVDVRSIAMIAREGARHVGLLSSEAKNEILLKIADILSKNKRVIIAENKKDISEGKKNKLSQNLLDRLMLNEERIDGIIRDVQKVAELKDFIGEVIEEKTLPNGLFIQRRRVPIGVIGMIYEARPNVTVDATCLALKSGNAIILKGGSDAMHSNRVLVKFIRSALGPFDMLNADKPVSSAVQLIDTDDHSATRELLRLKGIVDVIIPRGGKGLIDFVTKNATVPVIETGASVVHVFVDESADIEKAVTIVLNSKLRRTSICNALDILVIHTAITEKFFKKFVAALKKSGKQIALRADEKSHSILSQHKEKCFTLTKAKQADFDTEFLDAILAVKTVRSLDEALEHIYRHSLGHTEAIITEDAKNADRFLKEVDSACIYHNASTQFSDGAQFGLGAEIGISTQKLHARGPFALEGLTSYKWVIKGNGQIRES